MLAPGSDRGSFPVGNGPIRGKRVCFAGSFQEGVKEEIAKRVEALGGRVNQRPPAHPDPATHILVLGEQPETKLLTNRYSARYSLSEFYTELEMAPRNYAGPRPRPQKKLKMQPRKRVFPDWLYYSGTAAVQVQCTRRVVSEAFEPSRKLDGLDPPVTTEQRVKKEEAEREVVQELGYFLTATEGGTIAVQHCKVLCVSWMTNDMRARLRRVAS